jgi:transcriptional regulator with XRE-family HTH domain
MWYSSNVSVQNDQELNEVISSRIVKLRKTQQLRQEDVAEKLGIKQQSYARYEAGQRRIPVSILPTLAEALNTTIEELLGVHTKRLKRGRISQLEKRFEKINTLPPREQKFILEMLDRVLGDRVEVS